MLRGFRHTLFLLLQVGIVLSAAVAVAIQPSAWPSVLICAGGSAIAALICERIASKYLQHTLGRLRRLADDLGHGRAVPPMPARPGEDFYKLVSAINLVAARLEEAAAEEQRLQTQLRRSEKLAVLGELAANVAHEVNNPLDGIQNCSSILRRSLDDPERARQMLDLMDSGLGRIELIVRRLLSLAKQHVIRPERADLREIIDAAVEALTPKLDALGVRVVRAYGGDSSDALADAPLLEQVFVNLIQNAADVMPDGGELHIEITPRRLKNADMFQVDIADSGSGIDPDLLPHIFEPFFTTKSAGKGTGLGLAIAARIMDAHHGAITVASRRPHGTVFSVTIPAIANADLDSRPVAVGPTAAPLVSENAP